MWRRGRAADRAQPYERYDAVAQASSALIVGSYSSSFGLASSLLGASVRGDVRNIYALVRVADEIVDAPRPRQDVSARRVCLDELEANTHTALSRGSSSNLVIHAFVGTARRVGIGTELTAPFFASMRSDLDRVVHDDASLAAYIYGSAEVVGLMCLRVFVADEPDAAALYAELAPGARQLGAAFQKVNFLRDFGSDSADLGRRYLTGLDPLAPTQLAWTRLLDDVDADLAAAAPAIARLPASSRVAVCTAHDIFAELSSRLRVTPAKVAMRERVRVSAPVKIRLAAAAAARRGRVHPPRTVPVTR
ncbi:MAG: squalene/phytoene synthase family protein [Gordonia sp. (in: high G+C Gram-positive bacteria)]